MAQPAKKKKSDDNILKKVIFGRILSLDFFKRHWVSVFVVMVAILIYITNRYQCLTRMEDIRKLEQELEIVETERIREPEHLHEPHTRVVDAGNGRHDAS